MTVAEKLQAFRQALKAQSLDAYVVLRTDPHQSEYLPAHWEQLRWLSGFSGSAGSLVVTATWAGLWTDSRYFLQAEEELAGSGIELMKQGEPEVPTPQAWLLEQLESGQAIGVDAQLLTAQQWRHWEKRLTPQGLPWQATPDFFTNLWADRPPLPQAQVTAFPLEFAGRDRGDKLADLRHELQHVAATHLLLTRLDDIAWTFNLRGADIPYNPVFYSYALIGPDYAQLFIAPPKLPDSLRRQLLQQGISCHPYGELAATLQALPSGSTLWLAPQQVPAALVHSLPPTLKRHEAPQPVTGLKARKNETEQHHIREVMLKDGVAMVAFLHWLTTEVGQQPITELSATKQLEQFRRQQPDYIGPSFNPISGYGDHGAIVHYAVSEASDRPLEAAGIYLVDSGGQYLNGTTDITRTVAMGPPSPQQKRDFTLVLKGHIALARAVFPKGTHGYQLDVLAREPLWDSGLNFGHGTGHGVGFYLNVHEGPQSISARAHGAPLAAGMLTSNEPGIYRSGQYGIRIENLLLCLPHSKTEFGEFLRFETVTLCPIDRQLIEVELLSTAERTWLNAYHARVLDILGPYVPVEARQWLIDATRWV
jgi:Xaa-Pro aminopeptidase